jgi:hypothetical protein
MKGSIIFSLHQILFGRMRLAGLVGSMGEIINAQIWLESLKRDNSEDLDTDGRIILKCIKRKSVEG